VIVRHTFDLSENELLLYIIEYYLSVLGLNIRSLHYSWNFLRTVYSVYFFCAVLFLLLCHLRPVLDEPMTFDWFRK